MFLENMKEHGDGKSFSVEIHNSSGISEIISNEGKEKGLLKNLDRTRKFKHDSEIVITKVPKYLGAFQGK